MAYIQPKLNKDYVFNLALREFRRDKGLEAQLGHRLRRLEPTKDNIFDVALDIITKHSDKLANDGRKSRPYPCFDEARRSFYSRLLAEIYKWPELFDWSRGFASQSDAYSSNRTNSKGEKVHVAGIDEALYELQSAGMTASQVSVLTYNLLFNHVDSIKKAEIGRFNPFGAAARFYADEIKPHISELRVGAGERDRINHFGIVICGLGMKREVGKRASEVIVGRLRVEPAPKIERQMELLMNRKSLASKTEGLDSPLPLSVILQLEELQIKDREHKPKTTNRFANGLSLGRPYRDPPSKLRATG
jgi:hypothetical protein